MEAPLGLTGHRRDGRTVLVELGGPALSLTAIEPDVIRVRFSPTGTWPAQRSWAVVDVDAMTPSDMDVESTGPGLRIRSSAVEVDVDVEGTVSIRRVAGADLLADGRVRWQAAPPRCEWTQHMPGDRGYFGFGERTGLLDKRGHRYTCWTTDEWRHQGPETDALYVAVPFHMAVDPDGSSYGVLLDTTFRSAFDLTGIEAGRLSMSADAPTLDWYLINGPEPMSVVERLGALLGRAPMPPRWALGYHQARWSYGSEDEVRAVASGLRANAIPADAIHLDIDHMDRFRVFTWDRKRFPDPARLTRDLLGQGLRTTVVVDAAIVADEDLPIYADGRRRALFVKRSRRSDAGELRSWLWGGLSVLPDHTRPEVRAWWGEQYRTYLDDGVAGFLNDMNEPAMHDRPFDDPASENTEPPPDTPFGDDTEPSDHAEVRNVYALLQNQATAEALRKARPDERAFLVSRSGFAGVQRHAIVWTGDNWSYWEHLEMSLPQLMNLGLSGIPLAGADIGGFFADCPPELLVRWTQLGAFYPFARNNTAEGTARQEPWAWGEPTTSRCRRAIELRYRLLPYLYTVVEEAAATGRPILRPLFLHDPSDARARGISDEALLGRDLLIAPVVRPGKASREVYLPRGAWYDVRTCRLHEGGGSILAAASLDDEIPHYARAGSVLPMGPPLQWTGDRPPDPLTLHVFPDASGRAGGTVYEDDGASLAYRRGDWRRTQVVAEPADRGTRVRLRGEGSHVTQPRTLEIVVHGDGWASRVTREDGQDLELLVRRPR